MLSSSFYKNGFFYRLACLYKNLLLFSSLCSSGIIPSVAKLSPGQAAYHFLAGYQDGKFVPAYSKFLYINALELAKAFLSKVNFQNLMSKSIIPFSHSFIFSCEEDTNISFYITAAERSSNLVIPS